METVLSKQISESMEMALSKQNSKSPKTALSKHNSEFMEIAPTVFHLGFQKGRVLVLKKGTLVRCWIFKKGMF